MLDIGPLLFLFVHQRYNQTSEHCFLPVRWRSENIQEDWYLNDASKLQENLEIPSYCELYKLHLNIKKCTIMSFTRNCLGRFRKFTLAIIVLELLFGFIQGQGWPTCGPARNFFGPNSNRESLIFRFFWCIPLVFCCIAAQKVYIYLRQHFQIAAHRPIWVDPCCWWTKTSLNRATTYLKLKLKFI